jgi:hypothetical protein
VIKEDRLRPWQHVAEFQLSVARRWIAMGDASRTDGQERAFAFVSYFAALNGLYWLWGLVEQQLEFEAREIDEVQQALAAVPEDLRARVLDNLDPGPRGEARLLQDLVGRFRDNVAHGILADAAVAQSIAFFKARLPVRRMDKRGRNVDGDPSDGKRYQKRLQDDGGAVAHLQALAGIIYLVRCNLVHGSKVVDGLDEELLSHSTPPLRLLATEAKDFTEASCPWT